MAKMICLTPFRYAGKRLGTGEEFNVKDPKHVQVLALVKKAKVVEEESDVRRPETEEAEELKPKRRYRRRDMQAEDA